MPFEIFTADHNTTLSQVASLSRMNLRSPYTDAILADSDVPNMVYDCSVRCFGNDRRGVGVGNNGPPLDWQLLAVRRRGVGAPWWLRPPGGVSLPLFWPRIQHVLAYN